MYKQLHILRMKFYREDFVCFFDTILCLVTFVTFLIKIMSSLMHLSSTKLQNYDLKAKEADSPL